MSHQASRRLQEMRDIESPVWLMHLPRIHRVQCLWMMGDQSDAEAIDRQDLVRRPENGSSLY
jgi:hypothetical protein